MRTKITTFKIIREIFKRLRLSNFWNKQIESYGVRSDALKNIPRQGKKIFQVVGVPRSGTTLLAVTLDNHPEIICLSEPYLSWLQRGYFHLPEYLTQTFGDKYASPPHKFFGQLVSRKERFIGFKETYRSEIHHTFPNRSFITENANEFDSTIAVIRDPRDVWTSIISRSVYVGNEKEFDIFCHDWNLFSQWVLETGIFYILYEDLVQSPTKYYKKIATYLGFDFTDGMLVLKKSDGKGDQRAMSGGQISSSSIGRYEKGLTDEIRKRIENVCGNLMREFGYK